MLLLMDNMFYEKNHHVNGGFLKFINFLGNICESFISGDKIDRTKEYIIQSLRIVVGNYESKNIEIFYEIAKNKNILKNRLKSIFKTMDSMIFNFSPEEKKKINDDVIEYLHKTYKKETVKDVMEILK